MNHNTFRFPKWITYHPPYCTYFEVNKNVNIYMCLTWMEMDVVYETSGHIVFWLGISALHIGSYCQ